MQEMFQQYIIDMAPRAVRAGGAGTVGVGGIVQLARRDFAKLKGHFLKLGGKTFSGTETVIEVQEWMETCEEIFGDLELEDDLEGRMDSRQLRRRAKI